MAKIIIADDSLTDSEGLKLRIYKAKAELRKMKITDPWIFYKQFFKEDDTEKGKRKFQRVMNTQGSDKAITEKVERMVEMIKNI